MRYVLIAYAVLLFVAVAWLSDFFGHRGAIVLGILLAVPWIITLSLHRRATKPRKREYVYPFLVAVLVIGGTGLVVGKWFDEGVFHSVSFEREFRYFKYCVHRDPRFKHVDISCQRLKSTTVYLRGNVDTKADHEALIRLLETTVRHDSVTGYRDLITYPGGKPSEAWVPLGKTADSVKPDLVLDFDALPESLQETLKSSLSKAIADAANRRWQKLGITDEVEVSLFADLDRLLGKQNGRTTLSVLLVMPGDKPAHVRSITFGDLMTYTCVKAQVARPVANASLIHSDQGESSVEQVSLRYTPESGWERVEPDAEAPDAEPTPK